MSSFIEWPTLYGSSYFLPGIVVVVLLLALLLLMSSRRRASAERKRLAAEPAVQMEAPMLDPTVAAPAAYEQTGAPVYAPAVMTQSAGIFTQPVAGPAHPLVAAPQPMAAMGRPVPVAQPAAVYAQAAPAPSLGFAPLPQPLPMGTAQVATALVATAPLVTEPTAPPSLYAVQPLQSDADDFFATNPEAKSRRKERSSSRKSTAARKSPCPAPVSDIGGPSDPMYLAVMEILEGWGELSPEDVKRLELFRPDRLNATLVTIQLPKNATVETKARLSQLRQFGMDLERRAQAAQAAAAAAAAASTMPAPAVVPAELLAAVTPPAAPPTRTLAEMMPPRVEPPVVAPAPAPVSAPSAYESPTPAPTDDELASLWADPRPLWNADSTPKLEESPAPTYEQVDVDVFGNSVDVFGKKDDSFLGDDVFKDDLYGSDDRFSSTPAIPAAAAAVEPGFGPAVEPAVQRISRSDIEDIPAYETQAPVRIEMSPVSKSPYADNDLFWDDEPGRALQRLSVRVETAEQLLALPASERVDMAALLSPTELVAAFRATKDPELKRAVIDTLEHIGSPSSLNALGNCFEDSGADIQMYALAAADRLLGVV